MPPPGHGPHRYFFRLYALPEALSLHGRWTVDTVHRAPRGRGQGTGRRNSGRHLSALIAARAGILGARPASVDGAAAHPGRGRTSVPGSGLRARASPSRSQCSAIARPGRSMSREVSGTAAVSRPPEPVQRRPPRLGGQGRAHSRQNLKSTFLHQMMESHAAHTLGDLTT
ncbi:hypothetical protein ACIPYQ_12775 [Streptomyces sp. NPDC090045]|uniref:hypothetical protein n=1 Tax=Streptomyces sp. NPDC090045 TaxID=3365927 RepID=UPI0037FFE7BF